MNPMACHSTYSQRLTVFIRICQNIILKSIHSTNAYSLYLLRSYKKTIYKFTEDSSKYKLINTQMIFEFMLKNFLSFSSKKAYYKLNFYFARFKHWNFLLTRKKKGFLVMVRKIGYFERNLVYRSFRTIKNLAIESFLKKVLVTSAKQRAYATRICFIMSEVLRSVFNMMKFKKESFKVFEISQEFIIFDASLIINDKVTENLRYALKSLRFDSRIKKVLANKKLKAKFYLVVRNLNRLALQCFRSVFIKWSTIPFPNSEMYIKQKELNLIV